MDSTLSSPPLTPERRTAAVTGAGGDELSMAEIARAKLQEARDNARRRLHEKAHEEERKARAWRDYTDTFYTCGPTKLVTRGVRLVMAEHH